MKTNNFLERTRNKLSRAIKEIADQLDFTTSTIEVEYDANTMIYADVEVFNFDRYNQIELEEVQIARDSTRYKTYENLSIAVARKLSKIIQKMNKEACKEAIEWDYQKEFETVGGKYAYL